MPRFRSKPIEITAEQFIGNHWPEGVCVANHFGFTNVPHVHTAHDQPVKVVRGDWIVPEPDGRGFYPVKDDIFRAKYEEIR